MTSRSSLEILTLRQLRNKAMELEIARYSRMTKDQLLGAIHAAEAFRLGTGKLATPSPQDKEKPASAKFHAGGVQDMGQLAAVDEGLGDLPDGYGESRIVLLPRDPHWAYAYWDIPNEHKEELRLHGGSQLALRLYDVSELEASELEPEAAAYTVKEYPCDELAREWYLPIPVSDRAYYVEIGYRCEDSSWLVLARSATVMIPPTHPSDWQDEHFMTVPFDLSLHGQTLYQLWEPQKRIGQPSLGVISYQGTEVQQQPQPVPVPDSATPSADPVFGSQHLTLTASGSGLGQTAPEPASPGIPTDVELTIHGLALPQAQVLVDGKVQTLNSDGTLQLRLDLRDGEIQLPIHVTTQDQGQEHTLYIRLARAEEPLSPPEANEPQQ